MTEPSAAAMPPQPLDVAFMGLGNVGLPMARTLVSAGIKVSGWDIDGERRSLLEAAGGRQTSSAEAAVCGASHVCVAVYSEKQVEDVVHGALAAMRQGGVLIIHSTVRPMLLKELADVAADRGISVLDAPVSGGAEAASRGELTLMLGGNGTTADQAGPILHALAAHIYMVGDVGAASAMKIANNALLFVNNAAVCQAVDYLRSYGISERQLVEVASHSTGDSWAIRQWDYQGKLLREHGQARASDPYEFLTKDLLVATSAGRDVGVDMSLAAEAAGVMQEWYRRNHILPR